MSVAEFVPFRPAAPAWPAPATAGSRAATRSTASKSVVPSLLLTPYRQDADTPAIPVPHVQPIDAQRVMRLLERNTDVTDGTDAPRDLRDRPAPTKAFDGTWRGGLNWLLEAARPDRVGIHAWGRFRAICRAALADFGQRALDQGWTELEVFGCHADPFARRVDRSGLVALSGGLMTEVIVGEITSTTASMIDRGGSIMRMRLPIAPGGTLLWEAYRTALGP